MLVLRWQGKPVSIDTTTTQLAGMTRSENTDKHRKKKKTLKVVVLWVSSQQKMLYYTVLILFEVSQRPHALL